MTDSESPSITDKSSRKSATYSIHSLEDVPIRKSAVQIIRERNVDLIQPGSPSKKGNMQITKLVLKDPPKSPPRKVATPMVIKSIRTFTSSALTNGNGLAGEISASITKSNKDEGPEMAEKREKYKIIPLLVPGRSLVEQFESRKNERVEVGNEFQKFLVQSLNQKNAVVNAIETAKASTVSHSSENSSTNEVTQQSQMEPKSLKLANSKHTSSATTMTSSSSDGKSNTNSTASAPVVTKHTNQSESKSDKVPEMPLKQVQPRRPSRPVSKESLKREPEPVPKKEKSYDPQKAREFIKEQQAKRKLLKKPEPTAADKDAIKKRLDELRKSTQILVNKNVQKARKRSLSSAAAPSTTSADKASRKSSASAAPFKPVAPAKPLRKTVSTPSLDSAIKREQSNEPSRQTSATSGQSRRRSALLKADFSEKMGIMRKPEEVALGDVLLSPLRMKTPTSPVKQPSIVSPKKTTIPDNDDNIVLGMGCSKQNIERELKLDVPNLTLMPEVLVQPQEVQNDRKEFKTIPPWLKHTLLQPDPYPFIVAVRKKLEAIKQLNANDVPQPEESIIAKSPIPKAQEIANNQKCVQYLEALNSVPYINKPAPDVNESHNKCISSISLQPSESNTTSEISSIKSDFVLPLPPLSSTKIDSSIPKDSSKYHHDPFLGPISPLSVDRISNLKLTVSGSQLLERSVNFHRGSNLPGVDTNPDCVSFESENIRQELRPHQVHLNQAEERHQLIRKSTANGGNKSNKELEYQKMLEAFNRSLSRVIEVNQQLYTALQKPPDGGRVKIRDEMTQTTPMNSFKNSTGTTSNYSEDFERTQTQQTEPSTTLQPSTEQKSNDQQEKSPNENSSTTGTSDQTTSSEHSPDGSPSKTSTSESQLTNSRSFSLSDSHNTNPPPPEEYLPSFEESLRRYQSEPPKSPSLPQNNTSSIETEISEEILSGGLKVLRESHLESKSIESLKMVICGPNENPADDLTDANDQKDSIEFIKPPPHELSQSSSEQDETVTSEQALQQKPVAGELVSASSFAMDTTMGSDIMAIFNRTDLEVSILSATISETNVSYSSIGLYDQLIQNEQSKGDQLTSRARIKEKALMNRAKGQLAWLELQKQRYRERGMMEQISVIKKKQRAVLVRLEKERSELNKFKQRHQQSPNSHSTLDKLNSLPSSNDRSDLSIRKSSSSGSDRRVASSIGKHQQHHRRITTRTTTTTTFNSPLALKKSEQQVSQLQLSAAVRGIELEPSEKLENILQRREEELNKRRQHVQALLDWHQKLDREEQELLDIERSLLQFNQRKLVVPSTTAVESNAAMLNRIRSIDQSLQTLQAIPVKDSGAHSGGGDSETTSGDDKVQAYGNKLNRLWYRLTGIKEARYEPGRSYSLTKSSLERLYEDAKLRVLEGFRENQDMRKVLLEQSVAGLNSSDSFDNNVSINRSKNETEVHLSGGSTSETSSFKTTVDSYESVKAIDSKDNQVSIEEPVKEVSEELVEDEKNSVIDVQEIISRVSDITENINCILSSTTHIEELLQTEQEKLATDSVEFHTTVEESELGCREQMATFSYTSSFDEPTHTEFGNETKEAEESQPLIEDISLPPLMNDSLLSEANSQSTDRISEDIVDEISLEEITSGSSSASTPTTAEETETEHYVLSIEKASSNLSVPQTSDLEKRLICLNDSLGELNETLERSPLMRSPEIPKEARKLSSESDNASVSNPEDEYSSDKDFLADDRKSSTESVDGNSLLGETQNSKSPKPDDENGSEVQKNEIKMRHKNVNENFPHINVASTSSSSSTYPYLTPPAHGPSTSGTASIATNRMPDIINEAEVLRRQQLQIEQEIKQLEQQVVFFREIPNKPPPPYIPPANGSPLALIFPSEARIDELINSRTQLLFNEQTPLESINSDHVTNIYEKLILDMCTELYCDVRSSPPDVSFRTVQYEKRPLAFFNPPDPLRCLQNHMKTRIKCILNEENLQQQQQQQHCTLPYLAFANGGGGAGKRKRDQVDEILAQEMFDEEARWVNFDREEIEVKERIVAEIAKMLVNDAVQSMEAAWRDKNGAALAATLLEQKVQQSEL
ncbi:uncharacterized protein LOC129747015 [Uranotaenia lowii]|uniref:uncharacterized protein LOC129747015 n=1 Tax=Uranotaenia lowii TaxID=190385 RepID=UPI00247872D3|nr:uncharacterized protein LOC129747015 [Uranotaenia lowii]